MPGPMIEPGTAACQADVLTTLHTACLTTEVISRSIRSNSNRDTGTGVISESTVYADGPT